MTGTTGIYNERVIMLKKTLCVQENMIMSAMTGITRRSLDNAKFPPAGPCELIFVCIPDSSTVNVRVRHEVVVVEEGLTT